MKTSVIWKDGMEFYGRVDDFTIPMDAKAPIGKNTAPTPKELVAMGLGGCTETEMAPSVHYRYKRRNNI